MRPRCLLVVHDFDMLIQSERRVKDFMINSIPAHILYDNIMTLKTDPSNSSLWIMNIALILYGHVAHN